MERILVIYGTTDGHTAKVAQRIGSTIREQGIETEVVEAGTRDVTPQLYGGIVVCASLHARGYQRAITRWVTEHATVLRFKPTAFVSVCLGVLQAEASVQNDLDAIITRFEKSTGWQPSMVKKVAGALLYRKYGWIKRWVMKRIVTKAKGDTDTSRDYEYTDWNDVRAFATTFVGLVKSQRPKSALAAAPLAAREMCAADQSKPQTTR